MVLTMVAVPHVREAGADYVEMLLEVGADDAGDGAVDAHAAAMGPSSSLVQTPDHRREVPESTRYASSSVRSGEDRSGT